MLLVFAAALTVQLGYWLLLKTGFDRVREAPEPDVTSARLIPISVVVAARNETVRLPALLDALAAQTHADWEAVIVDDASEDATAALVEARTARDPRVRLARVKEPEPPRKKHALTLGIAAARHDRLAFTDADCAPPPTWLAALAAHAAREPEAVLVGYGPLRGPGALGALVRYETLVTALMTAAAVGLGRPYMAVGRNLSYPRSLFERIGGFAHSRQSLSGDDDLLVQEVARTGAAPVRYVLDPAAFVPSEAPDSWRAWMRQKRRHASAGRFYPRSTQTHLALFHASNLGVWLAPLFLGWTGAGLLAARLLAQRLVLREAARAFGEEDLMLPQPLLDLGYLLYNTLLAPLSAVWRPKRW